MLRRDTGFTLVEMMVTLVAIGILAVIGARTFSSLQGNADRAQAQENLSRVVLAQQQLAHATGSYSPYGRDLNLAGGDLTILDAAATSTGVTEVSMALSTKGALGLAVLSSAGCLGSVSAGRSSTQEVHSFDLAGSCSGSQALASQDADEGSLVETTSGGSSFDQW